MNRRDFIKCLGAIVAASAAGIAPSRAAARARVMFDGHGEVEIDRVHDLIDDACMAIGIAVETESSETIGTIWADRVSGGGFEIDDSEVSQIAKAMADRAVDRAFAEGTVEHRSDSGALEMQLRFEPVRVRMFTSNTARERVATVHFQSQIAPSADDAARIKRAYEEAERSGKLWRGA